MNRVDLCKDMNVFFDEVKNSLEHHNLSDNARQLFAEVLLDAASFSRDKISFTTEVAILRAIADTGILK